ncbi:MAG: extensin family protein [Polyangiaceae bacterium]|nr:extensin family protein [Polyangiaceae bacterium]
MPANGGSRFAIEPPDAEQARAFVYAAMSSDDCLKELRARRVPFERVEETKGVEMPIRFTGPIRGVRFRPVFQLQPEDKMHTTIADCRLGLALDDMAGVLAARGVVEAEYYSMYRKRGLGFIKPRKRHPGGRAIDLVSVTLKGGEKYSVRGDFHGRIGAKTCGEKAAEPTKDTAGARFWRDVVCDLHEKRSFNLLLTPNHDWGHRDHFHMEVRSDIRWLLIQ